MSALPLDQVQVISSLLRSMALHVLGSCLLLLLVLHCGYYICPSTLTQASACLSNRTTVYVTVVASVLQDYLDSPHPLNHGVAVHPLNDGDGAQEAL